jgi:hypothetical protein
LRNKIANGEEEGVSAAANMGKVVWNDKLAARA